MEPGPKQEKEAFVLGQIAEDLARKADELNTREESLNRPFDFLSDYAF